MMTADERREIQKACNYFTKEYLDGIAPLVVDGKPGVLTTRRIRWIKYYLGYDGPANKNNATVNQDFRSRIWHPNDTQYSTAERINRGKDRRAAQRKLWHENNDKAKRYGVGMYDGLHVANAAIPFLKWARAHGWTGRLVSGWRSPEYSESLCYRMCGRPQCPGMCAGKSSNHVGSTPDRFAVDVSDYVRFGQLMAKYPGPGRIWNRLPRDRVHFSPSGN